LIFKQKINNKVNNKSDGLKNIFIITKKKYNVYLSHYTFSLEDSNKQLLAIYDIIIIGKMAQKKCV
jgi:hypothetical protein